MDFNCIEISKLKIHLTETVYNNLKQDPESGSGILFFYHMISYDIIRYNMISISYDIISYDIIIWYDIRKF